MNQLFRFWIPAACCLTGTALILAGIAVLSLVAFKHLGNDAIGVATKLLGVGASLILSGAVSAALHAAWMIARGVKR